MLDERVCPSCQVNLPEGRTICPKCGRAVPPPTTGIHLIDIPLMFYEGLERAFGPIGAAIIAGIVFLLLVALLVIELLMKVTPAHVW
jgi:hypothetical protein